MDRASGVWTVRGVGLEQRKLAKAGAARDGVTLGAWVERAIELAANLETGHMEPVKKSPKAVQDWSMNPVAVAAGHVAELGPVVDCEVTEDEPAFVESVVVAPKGRKPRSVCLHGVEKGYNCWQCGGLAVIR